MNPKLHSSAKFSEKSPIWEEFGRSLKIQLFNVVEAGGDGSATCPDPQLVTDMADMHNLASVKGKEKVCCSQERGRNAKVERLRGKSP
jgi:hypothetical protein